ncbi:MAG: manganese catalase family protein [Mycobacterium leprae]
MFIHRKETLRPVKVLEPNPKWGQIILEQYSGSESEATALNTYLTQRFNTNIPEIRDLLEDIGTEEISHWEMIGELARQHGCVVMHRDSRGDPWSSTYADVTGNIITDLYSDIAGELRARDLYMHLVNMVPDPGSRDVLIFLGNREEAHAASFARALEALKGTIELPKEWFKHPYINTSPGTYEEFLRLYAPIPAPLPLAYPPQYPYPYATQYPPQAAGGKP